MAGDFPCVSTFCLWALLALTWLHRLPALSSMWEIIRHWAVVLLIFTGHLHTHYSWQARRAAGWTWGTISAGDSCLSLPPRFRTTFAVAYSTWRTSFLWVTLQGWTAQLSASQSCPVSCHLWLLAQEPSSVWDWLPVGAGVRVNPHTHNASNKATPRLLAGEFGVFFCIAEVRKPINFETNVCKYIY